jgi:hypothetical protein
LGLWCKRTYRKANKQDRADPEREPGNADLTDEVTQSDGQEQCQYRLASDDIAR